ncbi:MAG: meso-butanediol dehydrogenase / (S,S)-butanediol dehydrogenase / diacetyl reductase [Pseudonocardiales bacterium]|jgi:NAD(P)-dependent dehydrogenase (short-subunit alcohol dehydrogenase family)|nr:meso-butanediol dehydrogenase / (S,S)-butanediol dehydrogenase / diacetyl reductase [Pseudonocardiales bacterium]MDT4919447.1 meso-butanediol dehydrogenase / (S,S)-butanediol dehydrogenase / diacetyl reductase [Pseudonocardiales bacterium]
MNDAAGPVAIVTGAASGIGLATVAWLRAADVRVVAVDRAPAESATDDGMVTVTGDITDPATNEAMRDAAVDAFGGLDHLVLNAGVSGRGDIATIDLATVDRVIDVNLRATVLGLRACVPALRQRGGGSVVLTASVSAFGGEPDRWPYSAAKAGVVSLARSMAIDLGRDRIRVNAVCPGPIHTGISRHIADTDPERYGYLRDSIPLSRWGEADEVAAVIGFLLSPASSFVNGVALPVDGGQSARNGQGQPPGTW